MPVRATERSLRFLRRRTCIFKGRTRPSLRGSGGRVRRLIRTPVLITRRSRVRIPPPLLRISPGKPGLFLLLTAAVTELPVKISCRSRIRTEQRGSADGGSRLGLTRGLGDALRWLASPTDGGSRNLPVSKLSSSRLHAAVHGCGDRTASGLGAGVFQGKSRTPEQEQELEAALEQFGEGRGEFLARVRRGLYIQQPL